LELQPPPPPTIPFASHTQTTDLVFKKLKASNVRKIYKKCVLKARCVEIQGSEAVSYEHSQKLRS
jgi:hypothetical protein